MAIITTGNNFGATDAVTNTKLNNIANAATFDDPADETSLEKSTSGSDSGKLRIKDAGVTTAKLATSSSKTTGVTFAKMQHISTAKVLGRASASEGDVEEAFDFKDEDNMASNSATALASQQSIKAYVDSNGITQTTGTAPYFGVRAWASYNGITESLNASGNIASVVRNSTGNYTFTFTTAMPDANYSLIVSISQENTATSHGVSYIVSQSTTAFEISIYNPNNSGDTMNKGIINVSVIR